jgi:hypothetical protein
MIVPDANLLLYAYDSTSPFHAAARAWWEECLSSREPVGLALPVVFAFLRLCTHPRVYHHPMTLTQADAVVSSWLRRRTVQVLQPAPGHVPQVVALLQAAGFRGGNQVTDAQIAALAIAAEGVVHTADQEFRRFPALRYHFPLAEPSP